MASVLSKGLEAPAPGANGSVAVRSSLRLVEMATLVPSNDRKAPPPFAPGASLVRVFTVGPAGA